MKISRGTYPILFALLLFFGLRPTIEVFSQEIGKQLYFPMLIISIILIIIGIILAIKDKELVEIVTDERSKKVDQSAGYYSWWFTVFFMVILFSIALIQNITMIQFFYVIMTEMLLTMDLFHMYFNFRGKF